MIVDRLTKSTHFLHVKATYSSDECAKLNVGDIIRLHSAPMSIIADRDPRFTSRFWQSLQQAMGTTLKLSTTFHPQTDGHFEQNI